MNGSEAAICQETKALTTLCKYTVVHTCSIFIFTWRFWLVSFNNTFKYGCIACTYIIITYLYREEKTVLMTEPPTQAATFLIRVANFLACLFFHDILKRIHTHCDDRSCSLMRFHDEPVALPLFSQTKKKKSSFVQKFASSWQTATNI